MTDLPAFLRQQHAQGVRVYSSTLLVASGIARTGSEATDSLLALTRAGVLRASASVRCAKGHPVGEVPFLPGEGVSRRACRQCGEDGGYVEEGGGFDVFARRTVF